MEDGFDNTMGGMIKNKQVKERYGLGDIFWLKFHRSDWWPGRWCTEIEISSLTYNEKSKEEKCFFSNKQI